ncbi:MULTISPECIES: alpha-ketoglutarate-dependent dioxygenase AlkB [Cyanophyceae]|uniref:alpha-ketoglutarate-dependent dioxygenase AlkB n=1 Tax=Cyanophyceae TaxID=3028117 RepID=UPI00016DCEB1|nr:MULTISPECIES: alpha-ketoglutarate-dependent dioxygenase AlkB [Cyanophyceae]ACB00971.1 oxidoreductase, 2OG-Fe(II) oxygenase family [Picosynechococcus sp. PCC 7002]SMH58496.1 2OG-Fe(II) oxygenase superfamily protein [Picosynechococcus sp. OG1]SMQ86447.1 2OG-Fe(II) oxygenase superfamily protein [Synechococcus sp. 7002]
MNSNLNDQQLELFASVTINEPQIPGLQYIEEFIDKQTEQELLNLIDQQQWLMDLKRRVQHYGYKYDYRTKKIDYSMYLGILPDWLFPIIEQMVSLNLISELPDQAIVNEYLPGQGITSHVDCKPCFTDTIISLSLNAPCIMNFDSIVNNERQSKLLKPRSLVILQGESRYLWKHGIPPRKSDQWNGQKIMRDRRISITFRKVII